MEARQPDVILRLAEATDTRRLRILAQLDSAPAPRGPMLIAEVEGRLRAALPLDGGEPIADPFRRSADLVELLRTRAAQLTGPERRRRRRRGPLATTLSALERRTADLRSPKPLAPL
jgi:hypothetical protein